jgi:hypothetical protein
MCCVQHHAMCSAFMLCTCCVYAARTTVWLLLLIGCGELGALLQLKCSD